MASLAVSSDFHPRRGKARLRLGIPADLITVHGRHRVSLVDLSESGARLQCDSARISDGVLKWLGYEAFGAVVWREGEEAGLHFDQPIEGAWLLDTRQWLPEIARETDGVRRFAKEWVAGDRAETAPRPTRHRRAQTLPHLAVVADASVRDWKRQAGAMNWLRAGKPFIFGGVVVGLIAGYASILF